MDKPWPWPHSDWFQLHAAGWYAVKYFGVELTREETIVQVDALLRIGAEAEAIERMPL
jgi:hypothetical protein